MKKNGFTLIEILGVVAILGIIALIAVPNIISSLKTANSNKEKVYQNQLLQGAELYVEQNRDLFKERLNQTPGSSFLVKINDAVVTGYIKSTLTNPVDSTQKASTDTGCAKVTINDDGSLSYSYVAGGTESCTETSSLSDAVSVATITISQDDITKGTDYITVKSAVINNGATVTLIEYSKDGGITWEKDGTSITHTFSGLNYNTSYTITARVTSENIKDPRQSNSVVIKTDDLPTPTISVTKTSFDATSLTIQSTITTNGTTTSKIEYSSDGSTWVTDGTSHTFSGFVIGTSYTLTARVTATNGKTATDSITINNDYWNQWVRSAGIDDYLFGSLDAVLGSTNISTIASNATAKAYLESHYNLVSQIIASTAKTNLEKYNLALPCYLYNYGDQCTDITGGYVHAAGYFSGTGAINSNNLYAATNTTYGSYDQIWSLNTINWSNYKYAQAVIDYNSNSTTYPVGFQACSGSVGTASSHVWSCGTAVLASTSLNGTATNSTQTIMLNGGSGSVYLFANTQGTQAYIRAYQIIIY
jgi:prepilin-type N-terminal cleavage/methylation domain-containing protein